MNIKLIDFGGKAPERAHYNDAGADVFAHICIIKRVPSGQLGPVGSPSNPMQDVVYDFIDIPPHTIKKIPLGIGLELPDGFVAFVLPRSGMSSNKGITTEVVPVDSGYRGEIHAIVYNANDIVYRISDGDKIAQLVIVPTVIADFTINDSKQRGESAFGSSGDR